MKKLSFLLIFLCSAMALFAQKGEKNSAKDADCQYVFIETDSGSMVAKLYNETPQHRDNFVKLVNEGFYNGLIFHRVIDKFMIQGGDPKSKDAKPGQMLGNGNIGYRVPAEFNPALYHKKGALAAARDNNPEKASSACQFYIVQGELWDENRMHMIEMRYRKTYTDEQKEVYATVGGTPFLDMDYTVFGQVVVGLEVIDKIAAVKCDPNNRPVEDVKMRMTMLNKKQVKKLLKKLNKVK